MSLLTSNEGGANGLGNDVHQTPAMDGGDELQDGDNSRELEPGELVTPPHQQQGNASPALKKMLAKDVMNKALRKRTQIDTDNCEENVTAMLELEAIKRKEQASKTTPAQIYENGNVATPTAAADADDSEGLYSDTDSSTEEHKNVEDVQQARKEKQAEAAAAAATPQPPPSPHHRFLGLNPLRFHMRPPRFDYNRIGFMPRMPRGGMRGMRPQFFSRPPTPNRNGNRGTTPPTTTQTGSQGKESMSSGAYGPVLPPSQAQSQRQGAKRLQSELNWTTLDPAVSYSFNVVSDCENDQHKCCKTKQNQLRSYTPNETARKSHKDSRESAQSKRSRELPDMHKEKQEEHTSHNSRARSKEKRSDSSKEKRRGCSKEKGRDSSKEKLRCRSENKQDERCSDRKRDQFNEKHKTRSKEQRNCNNDEQRERSREHRNKRSKERTENDRNKQAERSKDDSKPNQSYSKSEKEATRDKPAERSVDKHSAAATRDEHRELSDDRQSKKLEQHRRSRSKSRIAKTPPQPQLNHANVQAEEVEPQLTPPTVPPPETKPADMRKTFDIFAESPPRLNNESSLTKPQPAKTTAELKTEMLPERSTTPPLENRHITSVPKPEPIKTTTPLLKIHSEIHSRIGALLEDHDLHLDALLATKEQLLRKSHEQRHKREAPRELHIKKEPIEQDAATNSHHTTSTRHANPFKRESVLTDMLTNLTQSPPCSMQRYCDREVKPLRRSDTYKERSIKLEKNRSRTPPLLTAQQIKVERNMTPPPQTPRTENYSEKEVPVRNGVFAANAPPPTANEHSPDTDDYIDNWENDDSLAGGDSNVPSAFSARFNGEDEDSNALWNANSTPPPKSKMQQTPTMPATATITGTASATVPQNSLFNIHDLYDKFMKSIKMSSDANESSKATAAEANLNSSLSNSTGGESSSETDATSSSSSSSSSSGNSSSSDDNDDEEDGDSSTDEDNNVDLGQHQQLQLEASSDQSTCQLQTAAIDAEESSTGKQFTNHKKNNVSKDLRKLKNLEDNLARIQMMRENYDSGDDICEELLKMESLFLMQRNAIMNKYRKSELKPNTDEELSEQQAQQLHQAPRLPESPVNNIFDANREAIKLTISPLKLSLKPTIFDKDEPEVQPQTPPLDEKLKKPPKEVAIVKPTIVDTRSKPPPPPLASTRAHPQHQLKRSRTRERSRSRSLSRNRFRRNVRPSHGKDLTRSPSPRRRRILHSPRRGRFGKSRLAMSHSSRSRSISRSRTRSRSPLRRRRLKSVALRRRSSLSPPPPPGKLLGPRSPPPQMRRRSYSRERCYSRSPLPFKPPSPPMRRSWSSSRSRSPTRRRSRSRSRSPHNQSYDDFFVENQSLEAAAYYYNMSLMQQDASGEQYDSYAAYMDSAYNMEQAYAQYADYSTTTTPASMDYGYVTDVVVPGVPVEPPSVPVLRELAMVPIASVAVQKGNVLEIVPSMSSTGEPFASVFAEEALEDKNKPKRKRVNFVDNVLPNYESDSEDRKIVQKAVERALRQYRERCSAKAAKLQRTREQLLAVSAPPPPIAPKPSHLEKAVLMQKKPKFRYYHFDPVKGAIVRTRARMNRPPLGQGPPRFDPKYMAMLVKSGRLPMPAFMRHRPPPPPAQADAMLQEFFSKHPPPPLHHVIPHYMRGPPPMTTVAPPPVGPQPIPVLGGSSYSCYLPSPAAVVTPVPAIVPLQAPLVPVPVPVLTAPSPVTSTPLPSMVAPFFTPPPLPTLSSHFTVQPVPTMREIIPMDILQKIGPLPKTLDLDGGNAGLDEANSDLNEARATSPIKQGADLNTPPPQLVET